MMFWRVVNGAKKGREQMCPFMKDGNGELVQGTKVPRERRERESEATK